MGCMLFSCVNVATGMCALDASSWEVGESQAPLLACRALATALLGLNPRNRGYRGSPAHGTDERSASHARAAVIGEAYMYGAVARM